MSDKLEKPSEKFEQLLDALPPRTREILSMLAELDRRDDWQQLLWIIESTGNGRYKDLGEVPTTPRVSLPSRSETDSERVRVRAFRPSHTPPARQVDAQ